MDSLQNLNTWKIITGFGVAGLGFLYSFVKTNVVMELIFNKLQINISKNALKKLYQESNNDNYKLWNSSKEITYHFCVDSQAIHKKI